MNCRASFMLFFKSNKRHHAERVRLPSPPYHRLNVITFNVFENGYACRGCPHGNIKLLLHLSNIFFISAFVIDWSSFFIVVFDIAIRSYPFFVSFSFSSLNAFISSVRTFCNFSFGTIN